MQELNLCYLMQCRDFRQSCQLFEAGQNLLLNKLLPTKQTHYFTHSFKNVHQKSMKWSTCFTYWGTWASPFILPFLPHPAAWYPMVLGSLCHQPLWSTTGSHTAACTVPGVDVLWPCFYSPLNIFHLLLLLSHKNRLNQCFHRIFYSTLHITFLSSRTKQIILCLTVPNTPLHHFLFWPCYATCRILVPEPELNQNPQQWKYGVLTTALPGNSPLHHFEIPIWDPLIPPGKLSG